MIRFIQLIVLSLGLAIASPGLAATTADFGIVPNDGIDDSVALQAAFDALSGGGTLTFTPGRYEHNRQLFINGHDITIDGTGALLVATDPTRSALTVEGQNITVKGLELSASGITRLTPDRTCGLLVYRSRNIRFEGNRVHGMGGCGIMLQLTDSFVLDGNVVYDTLADAIHMTNKTKNGLVQNNATFNSGDDGIAMVGYVKNGGVLKNITIRDNQVLSNIWGRGITVEGVNGALVEGNFIQHTSSACIILSSNASYNQYGVRNVVLSNNMCKGTNFNTSTFHGGILLSAREGSADSEDGVLPFTIENVSIVDNTIEDTIGADSHLRVSANCTSIAVLTNSFKDADSSHKAWTFYRGADVQQSGNLYNGTIIP